MEDREEECRCRLIKFRSLTLKVESSFNSSQEENPLQR
jgi:hypothetical protein